MTIRETTAVHDVADWIRRAIAEHVRGNGPTNRQGNKCSLMLRVTPQMARNVEYACEQDSISCSCFIESACWEFIRQHSESPATHHRQPGFETC